MSFILCYFYVNFFTGAKFNILKLGGKMSSSRNVFLASMFELSNTIIITEGVHVTNDRVLLPRSPLVLACPAIIDMNLAHHVKFIRLLLRHP